MLLRVYRLADGRLLLQTEEGVHDLGAHARLSGLPCDLEGLCAEGFFDPDQLPLRLTEGSWKMVDWEGPDRTALDLPVPRPKVGKILALGKNFRAHAAEFGEEVPEEPLFFNKLPETLVPHGATVTVPAWYQGRFDHEAELAVIIGKDGKEIPVEQAMEHVCGYTVADDLTARSLQGADRKKGFPWLRGKNMDGTLPLGPCFVPRQWLDISDLRVTATVNGELRQDATTADLVVDVPHALAYLSRHLTLRAGDIVLMGTPEGVGPLEDGDEVVCAVEGIGELRTRIARPSA